MIYLDYNATTPLASEVLDAMRPYLDRHFGNASSIHAAGREARAAIDDARDRNLSNESDRVRLGAPAESGLRADRDDRDGLHGAPTRWRTNTRSAL